jgi:hypothetical protein
LAGQLSDLDRRQGLEDAKRRLREQTADLLQASKDALKDKDSDDAKNRLNNIVASMKVKCVARSVPMCLTRLGRGKSRIWLRWRKPSAAVNRSYSRRLVVSVWQCSRWNKQLEQLSFQIVPQRTRVSTVGVFFRVERVGNSLYIER